MTTQEVANRLVELCRMGQMEQTQTELYADDATSTEADDSMGPRLVNGLDGIKEKGKMFMSMVEEFHSSTISEPVVAGHCFSLSWAMDVTMKGQGRSTMEEICVYKVKDGQITGEWFFY
ncbi:MAG: nuclear transport factor 2 family protein [Taibaiella sp.]|nr:nuclear transport factor 2 family protein [Taibaiella sp.]